MPTKVIKQHGSRYWYAVCRDINGRRFFRSTKQTDKTAAIKAARQLEVENAIPGVRPYALAEALTALTLKKTNKLCAAPTLKILANQGARLLEYFGPGRDINTLAVKEIDGYVVHRRSQRVINGHRARYMKADPEKVAAALQLHSQGVSMRQITKRVGLNRATIASHLRAPKKTDRTISDATIRKELGKLMEAVLLAKRDGHFPGEPSSLRTDLLKPDRGKKRWLPVLEYKALWENFEIGRDWLTVMVHTGARWGELLRITGDDIDHEKREILLHGSKGHHSFQERLVPLSPYAYEVLVARTIHCPTGALFSGWSNSKFSIAMKRACKRAGIVGCSPNDLRRTFTTWHAMFGTVLEDLKGMLGHSPASKTAEMHYRMIAETAGHAGAQMFPAPAATPAAHETKRLLATNTRVLDTKK